MSDFPEDFYGNLSRLPNLSSDLKDYSNLELLRVQKRQVHELIISVQTKPRPSYDIDGQKVDWTEYLEMLYKQLARIDELISIEEGPSEEEIWAYT